jgi:SynChlorMet cassette protein ScmD
MRLDDRPIANPVVVFREEFDDWAVLFNPDTADAVGINPVGAAIWKLMDGQRTVDEVVAHIQSHFANVPGSAADEIRTFIEQLAEQGFVGYEIKETQQESSG